MEVAKFAASVAVCAYAHYNYLSILHKKKTKKSWKKRRWWITAIHRNRTRLSMEKQLSELLVENSGEFENFMRMSYIDFEYLLNQVSYIISKKDTQMREAIPARVRLAITLRYLASGDSYRSLHFLFKISSELISKIVPEVCSALNKVLKDQIKLPSSQEEWLEVEKGFSDNFPHAIGSIDGKHVTIRAPPHTATDYYNYKGTFSIVLLAVADSKCRFIFADIGCKGRISDGGVLRNCNLWNQICNNNLNLPTERPLPGSHVPLPYVFLADGAFALTTNIMKPYPGTHALNSPQRIFNETLSRSRVKVENTFGILAAKFRIFGKPIALCPEKVNIVTMTCILLHNFLINSKSSHNIYTPPGTIDEYDVNGILHEGSWRQEVSDTCAIRPIKPVPRRPATNAIKIREEFTSYFFKFG